MCRSQKNSSIRKCAQRWRRMFFGNSTGAPVNPLKSTRNPNQDPEIFCVNCECLFQSDNPKNQHVCRGPKKVKIQFLTWDIEYWNSMQETDWGSSMLDIVVLIISLISMWPPASSF